MRRPISSFVLIFLTLFQALSAIPAALALVMDPTGAKLGMPITFLQHSPFSDFLIPGLFLLIVLGFFPVLVFYGLVKKNKFPLAEQLNLYPDYHWSWTFAFYLGLILILWINMQQLFIREFSLLQFVYSMLGVAMIITAHLPATKSYYHRKSIETK